MQRAPYQTRRPSPIGKRELAPINSNSARLVHSRKAYLAELFVAFSLVRC